MLTMGHSLSAKVGTNFAEKQQSLVGSSHGYFFNIIEVNDVKCFFFDNFCHACLLLPHTERLCCTSVWLLRDEVNHQEINFTQMVTLHCILS